MQKDGLEIPKEWTQIAESSPYYKLVFITPPWEAIYAVDSERKESFEDLNVLHEVIVNCYTHFGYKVVLFPIGSIAERTAFILKQISNL